MIQEKSHLTPGLAMVALALVLPHLSVAAEVNQAPVPLVAPVCLAPGMLGTATIDNDHTLTLTYRGPNPQQTGYAQLTYRPGTPDYDAVAAHIGDIKPGDVKQITPWFVRASS